MKKFAALVLAGAMTLGLAACGGGQHQHPGRQLHPCYQHPRC